MSAEAHVPTDETVELAKRLISIPSMNPPGNEATIAAFVSSWLHDVGVTCQHVPLNPGRRSIVARIPGTGHGSVVFCAHLDTVPAEKSLWNRPPFEPMVVNHRLWGLGAADMKSAVAVLVQSFAVLATSDLKPNKDCVLMLTADEEWGYRGAASVANAGLIDDAELLVIAEPTENNVYTGQKGELWIEATFAGHEAHGSVPESGANAVLACARFCDRIHQAVAQWPEIPSRGRTSLNVGQFHGGRRVNIVPAEAKVQLDLRVASADHRERAMALVSEIGQEEASTVGGAFATREMTYHPPIASSVDHPWARTLIDASQAVTGRTQPVGLSPYSTDAVAVVPVLDIPTLICGPGSILQAHQPNEFIALDQIVQSLRIFGKLLGNAASVTKGAAP